MPKHIAAEDYWGNHRPGGPSDAEESTAAPAHALDRVYPPDVYTHPHYYGSGEGLHGGPRAFNETVQTLRRIRGNPEAPVTMYRALPPEHADKGFRTGDWVSVHHSYAEGHGMHPDDPSKDWPVIKTTVPAKHLWNNGDSLDEFGYHGPPVKGEISHGAIQHRATKLPPQDLHFEHQERQTGGSKWPTIHTLRAYRATSDDHVGELSYYTHPRRKTLLIDGLHVASDHQRQGIGSALMDELQRRHSDHAINHGDRTYDGKKWWAGYSEGKPVNRGRTAVHIDEYQHSPSNEWFHGSSARFKQFKKMPSQSGDWNTQIGPHFSSEPEVARQFGPNVHRVQLDIDNPKIYKSEADMDHEVMLHEYNRGNTFSRYQNKQEIPGVRGREAQGWSTEHALQSGDLEAAKDNSHHWLSNHPDRQGIVSRYVERLKDAGHDGIVYGNDWERPGHACAIPLDHSQIHMQTKTASMVDEYRWAQDAQNRRADAFSGGNKTESDSYFGRDGEGDAQEKRVNFKDWLVHNKGPEEVRSPWENEYWRGHSLGTDHGEDMDHADFKRLPHELEKSEWPDHFFSGYSHGLENAVPNQRIAVLVNDDPIKVYAHVSGNQIDVLHCPFCGSGAVIARSDGTIECGYCTSVFTVQVQPQYNGFPQSVNGQPYQWPGMPEPPGVPGEDPTMAEPDLPEGTNVNPNTNGSGGIQSSDPADATGDDDEEEDDDKPAFLKGKSDDSGDKSDDKKGKNPFAKKKSYRTVTGAVLGEDDYLAHLAISFASNPAKVARMVKESRKG